MGSENGADFAAFWEQYPRRVGKIAAEKAYWKALTLATHAQIMAGVERYIQTKPGYADFCHPTTFLRQGRWMDEVEPTRQPLSVEDQRILARRRMGL